MAKTAEQLDRNSADHLLACPRCSDLCEDAYVYCFECGARLLPSEYELEKLCER